MARIDSTAQVDLRAEIGEDVEIGPYCVVGPDVTIGRGTRLLGRVCLVGRTVLGEGNVVGASVLGGEPQDHSYHGAPTRLEIGDHNVIHEGVTAHRATEKDDGVTRIGSHVVLGAGSHVAHDCKLADHVTLAEGAILGGHVHVETHAYLGPAAAVHHYVTIGAYSLVGAKSKITQDVPPYMVADGNPASVTGLHRAALRSARLEPGAVLALREAYRLIFRAHTGLATATKLLDESGQLTSEVRRLLDHLQARQEGTRGRARDH